MNVNVLFSDAAELLKNLINRPSFSKEEDSAAHFLNDYLLKKGFFPQRKGNNIWLLSPDWDSNKPTILLNSHIDTVKPTSDWTRDPFAATEENGKLFGLGSNDAGASLVSLLQAFCILTNKPQPNNFIFLASCEEEISGKNGVESVLPDLPDIALGIVGEPTDLQAAIAEKGLMVLDAVIYGKSGHAARNEGENAIYKTFPVINWFKEKRFDKISPLLGPVKMSVTMINAGTQHNVIPGECRVTVDVRTNEFYQNKELFNQIKASCCCEIQARSFRLNSSHISANHPVVQKAISLGSQLFGSPTLSDQALMNFPTLKIGPGSSSRSHAADEFIYLTEIREAIDFYVKLLNNLKL